MKKQRNGSLAPIPSNMQNSRANLNNFKSARHSIEPSKKYNQYLVRHEEYGSANNGFSSKKKSISGKAPSEADASSDLGNRALAGKYFLKDPVATAAMR